MLITFKCIHVVICLLIVCDVTLTPCLGQRNSNRNNKPASSGGKFVPGKKPANKPYYPPRSRGLTLGDVLRKQGHRGPTKKPNRIQSNGNQNPGTTNAEQQNRRNLMNNIKNNNDANSQNHQANSPGDRSVVYPNLGKITPPLTRSEGEKPPFAPSWTHCVISVQVSIAWVIVKSPHYPNKFQGQVQCSWIATAMEGYRVRLSFKDLDLLPPIGNGCGNQFVEVIDMELEKSQARFCGSSIPGDYVSSGKQLRVDLQADAIQQKYRGFLAAFRADREVPGRRETSYFAHGVPDSPYNPLTESPPVNPGRQLTAARPIRRPVLRPTTPSSFIPGQNIYGSYRQPKDEEPESKEAEGLENSTTHLYIIIAVILVILVIAATAYVFKRHLYKHYQAWRKQKRSGDGAGDDPTVEKSEMQTMNNGNGIYNKQAQLPGMMPLPPTPNFNNEIRGRENVSFVDDFGYHGNMQGQFIGDPIQRNQSMTSLNSGRYGFLQRSHSLDDVSNNFWMQNGNGEPIYEDDAMSIHSVASSIRSSNRHPDHNMLRQQKMLERQNSMRMRSNSFTGDMGYFPPQNVIYNSLDPYQTQSLYDQQTYGTDQMQYGSLPPTNGPNPQGMAVGYPGHPMPPRQLYTSSMSNLTSDHVSNFMLQPGNDNSKSMFDVSNSVPDITSQWSNTLEQRHPSVTSSTNTSATNPILKKTTPTPQHELAFSALRAAKSMNDLTAINTKLNECVSWTLPSQRRKSIVG